MVAVLSQEMKLLPLYHRSMEIWDSGNLPPGDGSYEIYLKAAADEQKAAVGVKVRLAIE